MWDSYTNMELTKPFSEFCEICMPASKTWCKSIWTLLSGSIYWYIETIVPHRSCRIEIKLSCYDKSSHRNFRHDLIEHRKSHLQTSYLMVYSILTNFGFVVVSKIYSNVLNLQWMCRVSIDHSLQCNAKIDIMNIIYGNFKCLEHVYSKRYTNLLRSM